MSRASRDTSLVRHAATIVRLTRIPLFGMTVREQLGLTTSEPRGTGIVLERVDRPSHDGGAGGSHVAAAITSPWGARKPLERLIGSPWNG